MSIETATQFFIDELKDIYSAEKQAIRLYPKIAKAAEAEPLKAALKTHLEQTKAQLERLDRVFALLEKRPTGKKCAGMEGVLAEAQEAVEEAEGGPLRDAALIASVQRSEHYEIAAYGTVLALAKAMGEDEIASLLAETLEEEKSTDKQLTAVSKSVNKQAIALGQQDEDEAEIEEEDAPAAPAKRKPAKKASTSKG